MLKVNGVTVRYGERTVVNQVSFHLEEGQWLMLAGPNGAGKSTLIEAIAQGVPYTGEILLEGRNIRTFKAAQLARRIGVLSQRSTAGYAYTVEEVVGLGRYAYAGSFLGGKDADGEKQVEHALALMGLEELRHKSIMTLSGGELQRTFLAQVLAQDPRILILDEPANHLDLDYQRHVFTLLQTWLKQPGRAVISVAHDLSLAKRYGTHTLLMHCGQCVAQGQTDQVLTPERLSQVYGMDVYAWMRSMLAQWS